LKPEICSERTNSPSTGQADSIFCEYVQTFGPNISYITTGTFNLLSKTETQDAGQARGVFPPERCVFSPHDPQRGYVRPRNLSKLSRPQKRCQPTEVTGFPPDFNSPGSLNPARRGHRNSLLEKLLRATENGLSRRRADILAHEAAKDSS